MCADHGGLPGATRRLRVQDGGVQWVAADRGQRRAMRVVGAGAPPPGRLAGARRAWRPRADGGWVALVEAAHSDALLAAVLAAGASVREVGPA